MTSISSAFLANATSNTGSSGSSDTSKRITAIHQQLQELQQQIKDLKDADIPEQAKEKLRKAFQQQIDMLIAELSRLQTERDKTSSAAQSGNTTQPKNNANEAAAPRNATSAQGRVDIYV